MTQHYLRVAAEGLPRATLRTILARLHGQGEPPIPTQALSDGYYYVAFAHPATRAAVMSVLEQMVVGHEPVEGLPNGGRLQASASDDFYMPGPNGGYMQLVGRRPVTGATWSLVTLR